jgi:beta-fructofuranosidase
VDPAPGATGSFNAVLAAGADFGWTAGEGTAIRLTAGEKILVTLSHANNELIISLLGNDAFRDVRLPVPGGSRVRAIIDHGTLEISAREGIVSVPLPVLEIPLPLSATALLESPELRTLTRPSPATASGGHSRATTLEHMPTR